MPKRRPWETELALWIQLKVKDPSLSAREFFRRRKINEKLGARKIGKQMRGMWEAVKERTMLNLEKKGAFDLTKEVGDLLEAHKREFNMAKKNLLVPDGTTGLPRFVPRDFGEAMRMLHGGSKGVQGAVHTLSGGEPLVPVEPRKYVLEWIPPESYRSKRPKKKKPKKKTKKRKKR